MENKWRNFGGVLRLSETSQQLRNLPVAIYKLQDDKYGFYLTELDKQFDLPEKIYGLQTSFIERVKRTWENTEGNMGILLNGLRGTGKTVTAEMICNEMQLPVIVINDKFEDGVTHFINELQDDCIIFFDEYDKIYEKYSSELLTVMDGVMKRDVRIMFLLTTNDDFLNENMYQRPSRIRYIKTFGNLEPEVVFEVVDDLLIHKELREATIKFISELTIITIDLVKSIVQEVNIHHESPEAFADVYNVRGTERVYKVSQINKDGKAKVLYQRATIDELIVPFNTVDTGSGLYVNGRYLGSIMTIVDKQTLEVQKRSEGDSQKMIVSTYHFEPVSRKHYSFNNLGF